MTDPIVEEVRRIRDAHAARFNYDLNAIFRDIKEREKESGLLFIDGVARQPAANRELRLKVVDSSQSPEAEPQAAAAAD